MRSPGAAVACRARFHPLSPSVQTEARGCTPKLQAAFSLLGWVSRSLALQGQGAVTPREVRFSARVPGVHNGIAVPLCTLRLQMTLPHSGDHGALACLAGNSSGSLFQEFHSSSLLPGISSPQVLQCLVSQAQRIAETGYKPHLRVFYGTRSAKIQRGLAQPSSAVQVTVYRCTGFCGCCLKQVMSFICVAITLFNYLFVSGPG